MLLVAAGVTLYLRRAVVRPVVTVADATGRLAGGDLSARVPARRHDELGDLARGFNAMADSLQRSRDELEHSNAELEALERRARPVRLGHLARPAGAAARRSRCTPS